MNAVKKIYFWLGILLIGCYGIFVSGFPQTVFAQADNHFSLILLPDTQAYVLSPPHPDRSAMLESQVSWILSNLQSQKIAFVLQEGDMTNNNTQDQWDKFSHAVKRMDGIVPYALTVGNHDHTDENLSYPRFNYNFPVATYKQYPYFGGSYKPDQLQNAYYLFSAGGRQWLVLSLAYGMTDDVLTWAGQIADQYSTRKIIVLTHCYMYFDSHTGNPQDNTRVGQVPPYEWGCYGNTGEDIWNKFAKLHKNIAFVFSGHVLGTGIGRRVDTGTYGNQVYQILSNFQVLPNGGDGYLRIVDIYPDDKKFLVKTYSPYTNLYKTDGDNQFQYTSVNSLGSDPIGYIDRTTCMDIAGWTCDADDYTQALSVHFYRDGPYGSGGVLLGSATADKIREQTVGDKCSGNRNHGFNFTIPDSLKDGTDHAIYAYGVNVGAGKNVLLSGSPKTVHCTAPTPSTTPIPKPGDLNGDNKIDIFDYNILVSDFGKTGSPGWIPADINKDGKVDIFDYNVLVENFGK